jgi:lysophospholipase L1-like esterase
MAWTILELYNAELRRVAREQGVPLIDLAQELPRSTRLFYDAMHFTREGAEELARLVAARLCPALAERFPAQSERPCDCRGAAPNAPGH